MGNVGHFVSNHWLLCAAFIVVLLAIFYVEARSAGVSSATSLTPPMVTRAINHEQAVIVDIRDANAFRDGHIVGAINVPMSEWETQQNRLQKYKSKPVIIADAMGQKSQAYVSKLSKAGYEGVKFLNGGINGWRNAKLPLVKGSK